MIGTWLGTWIVLASAVFRLSKKEHPQINFSVDLSIQTKCEKAAISCSTEASVMEIEPNSSFLAQISKHLFFFEICLENE